MKNKVSREKRATKCLSKRLALLVLLLVIVSLSALQLTPENSQVQAQNPKESTPSFDPTPVGEYKNNTMYIGTYVIDIYDFEYKTGSYTLDFYLYFAWISPNITNANWYLMNGYPVEPSYKTLVEEDKTGDMKFELWRVRAFLDTNPEPTNYPFDTIEMPIIIELVPRRNNSISFYWLSNDTGIGPKFSNAGFGKPYFELQTSETNYFLGRDAPQAVMMVKQDRNIFGAVTKTILPPILFCLVAGVCFLFKMYDESAFGLRVGIATSMLITAILFNISEQNDLPPVSSITVYGSFSLAVTIYLVLVTVFTVLGYVGWMRLQERNHVERVNMVGFAVALLVPILVFAVLYLLR